MAGAFGATRRNPCLHTPGIRATLGETGRLLAALTALGEQAVHWRMNEITRILSTLDEGDPLESDRLLPLVYEAAQGPRSFHAKCGARVGVCPVVPLNRAR